MLVEPAGSTRSSAWCDALTRSSLTRLERSTEVRLPTRNQARRLSS